MKLVQILELVVKYAPVLQKLLSRQTQSELEVRKQAREKAREAAKNVLLNGKAQPMPATSPSPSPRGVLSKSDVVKLLRLAAVVAAGAGLSKLVEGVPGLDLGPYDDLVTPVIVMVLEALRRLVGGPPKV